MIRDTGVVHECRLCSHPVQSPLQWAAFERNGKTIFVVTLVKGRVKLPIEKKLADDVVEEIVRALAPADHVHRDVQSTASELVNRADELAVLGAAELAA